MHLHTSIIKNEITYLNYMYSFLLKVAFHGLQSSRLKVISPEATSPKMFSQVT